MPIVSVDLSFGTVGIGQISIFDVTERIVPEIALRRMIQQVDPVTEESVGDIAVKRVDRISFGNQRISADDRIDSFQIRHLIMYVREIEGYRITEIAHFILV